MERDEAFREGAEPVDGAVADCVVLPQVGPARDRRAADRRLRESEERYRALVTATAQLMWTADADGMTNPDPLTWCAFTGQSVEEAAGTGWLSALHPDDQDATARRWRHAVRTTARFEMEYRVRRHDGVYRTFLARGVPVLEEDGRVREWVGTCNDVTERIQAETERSTLLSRAQAARTDAVARANQLEAIFESITDGVIAFDREGRIVRANTAARSLLAIDVDEQAELDSRPAVERVARYEMRGDDGRLPSPDRWPLPRILAGEVLTGSNAADVMLRALDGHELHIRVSGAPVRDENGIAGAVVIFSDVTERRRLERRTHDALDALREANRRMDEFLSIASHELRTPLTTIKGNIQLAGLRTERAIADDVENIDAMVATLSSIGLLLSRTDRQVGRLNRLVNDLLDVSRIQAGHLEMVLAPCDLVAIVRESIDEQRQVWPQRAIHAAIGVAPVPVNADADRIAQVVTNYLINALKYSADDAPVAVTLERDGADVYVRVRDAGPGLDSEARVAVWERFRRVEGVPVRSGTHGSVVGLGLGLYISKTIIERHGGRVGVDSVPGAGSTFWFCLPLASEA